MNLMVTLVVWFGFAALFVGGLFFLYWVAGQNVLVNVALWFNESNVQANETPQCIVVIGGHVVCFNENGTRINTVDGKLLQ